MTHSYKGLIGVLALTDERQCMECSIRREGAVVAAVFRPVVFFKFIAEPYKFLTTKK